MNYGELIRRPLEIVARRPYLWLLGFLAGGGAMSNFGSSSSYRQEGGYTAPSTSAVQGYWNGNWEWIVAVLAILLLIGIVMFVLGCIADGGIIRAAVEHDEGRPYRLGVAWRQGYSTGWRIAGIRLLTLLLIAVPAVFVTTLGVAAAASASTAVGLAVILGLAAALAGLASLVFWLVLSVAAPLGERSIVLENTGVIDGLANGFRLIRWHFKEVAVAWLIMLAVSIVASIATAIFAVVAAVAIGIPAGGAAVAAWWMGGTTGVVISVAIFLVFLVGALLAAAGLWSAYSSVYWTLLFNKVRALPVRATSRPMVSPA